MTFITPDYDEWTEDAYTYIRNTLRTDATVGIQKAAGFKSIEIGTPNLALIASHPESLPVIWIEPAGDTIRRQGEVIEHAILIRVHVYSTGPLGGVAEYADAQADHRERAGQVYNRVFALHTGGQDAGHWSDWEPYGTIEPEAAAIGANVAAFHSVIPFRLSQDRIWNTGV